MKRPELDKKTLELLTLWKEARGTRPLPHYSFINPTELRPWIGDLTIIRVREGEKRFYVSLHGGNVSQVVGCDLNHKFFEDVFPESSLAEALDPYELSMKRCEATFSKQKLLFPNGLVRTLLRLVLPFCASVPDETDRFLVYIAPISDDSELPRTFYNDDGLRRLNEPGRVETSELFVLNDDDFSGSKTAA